MIQGEPPGRAAGFIGRADELAALVDALGEALAGTSAVVLLQGEAGIGKTRLLEELEGLAAARRVPVVWGRASSMEGAPPFWLWQQVLRDDGLRVERRRRQARQLTASCGGRRQAPRRSKTASLFKRVRDALVTTAEARGCHPVDDLGGRTPRLSCCSTW